tara:strand:+ start:4257 stop:6308 length:2052 start_codon:yes stop_codon:yes gene_type:complete
MYRPFLLLLAVVTPQATGQEIYLSPLSRFEFLLETKPMQERCQKEIWLANALVQSSQSRLAKMEDLKEKGFSSTPVVEKQRQRVAGNQSLVLMWQTFARAVSTAETRVQESSSPAFTNQTSVLVPGITQRIGNINLFTLRCQPGEAQLQSAIAYLEARKVPTNLGKKLGELDRNFLSGLGEAIEQLNSPYASDVGRYQSQLFHAASHHADSEHGIEQLERDIARLKRAVDDGALENVASFPWLSQPLGLLGSGWRCGTEASPEVIALCLPIAKAQESATAPIELAKLQLELAEHRLKVKTQARTRNVASDLELEAAQIQLTVARTQLAANQASAAGHRLRYEQLLGLLDRPPVSHGPPHLTELAQIEKFANAKLEPLLDSPQFVYGWLKNLEGWLRAWNSWENARQNQQFEETQTERILALKKTTENERRKVTLKAQLARAVCNAAREQLHLKALEFDQWIAIAELARKPRASTNEPIPETILASSLQVAKTNEALLRAIHTQRAAYFHYQANHVAKLEKVHAKGAATAYEVAQNRSRLAMAQGTLESLQPSLEIHSLEQELHFAIGKSAKLRSIHDLGENGTQLLSQIAAARQRPNPGLILHLEAAREFAERRAERMEPLVAKGYATKLEQDEVERNRERYRLIAQSERNRELAVIPAVKLLDTPDQTPNIPLAGLVVDPLN